MFAVICREPKPTKWMVNRQIEDVKDGDVVVFLDKDDADRFVEQDRAEHISAEELAEALAQNGEAGEPGEGDGAPAPAKTTKKKGR